MRLRLLIDAEVPDEEIGDLAERIAEQPPTHVQIADTENEPTTYMVLAGRLMGAQQVQAGV
jgi:hypothetical protein